MLSLTTLIRERDTSANELCVRMGVAALPELSSLYDEENNITRILAIEAASHIDLAVTHELIFKALDDEDINVIHAAIAAIEKHQANISTTLLKELVDKLTNPDTKNRIILLLGQRLTVGEAGLLDKYCTVEYPQSIALHCMAALAKIGVELRRQQFGAYLLSIKSNPVAFNEVLTLVKYIDQSWLLPTLRLLLNNKESVQGLSTTFFDYPHSLRVCDKAVLLIARILKFEFSFDTKRHKNFTNEQLAEVNLAASNYHY